MARLRPPNMAGNGSRGAAGHDVRVGLEDVLTLPNGEVAASNAELVATAVRLIVPEEYLAQ